MSDLPDQINDEFEKLRDEEWVDELIVEYYHKINDGFYLTVEDRGIGVEQMGDIIVFSIYDLDDGQAKERERGSFVVDDWVAEKLTSMVGLASNAHDRIREKAKERANQSHPAEGNDTGYIG